jgi:hypothetical protein
MNWYLLLYAFSKRILFLTGRRWMVLIILCLLRIALTYLVVLMANSCKILAESRLWSPGWESCVCPKEVFEMFRIWKERNLSPSLLFPFQMISSSCLERMK